MKLIKSIYAASVSTETSVNLPFKIPSFADVLSYVIRFFFILAGLAAMLFLILGAFSWITSSGDKEAVNKAQQKIQAAVVGLIILVAALTLIVTVEQVIFNGTVCLGLTCPINFGNLLTPN